MVLQLRYDLRSASRSAGDNSVHTYVAETPRYVSTSTTVDYSDAQRVSTVSPTRARWNVPSTSRAPTELPTLHCPPNLPRYPEDDEPVVPLEHANTCEQAEEWDQHQCAPIVLALLFQRGIVLPYHRSIVDYHMARGFLDAIDVLRTGGYFIHYKQSSSGPKERFFRVVLDEDQNGCSTPYLAWYVHAQGVTLVDRVPLVDLVGVTTTSKSPAFRRHMIAANTITGCFAGGSRAKLQASGCFSLWFLDGASEQPQTVDLLTTDSAVFRLWVLAFRAFLSVNSVSVSGKPGRLDLQMERVQRLLEA